MINVNRYVGSFLEALDTFVRDNINELTGQDLVDFYKQLFERLKREYFGGSWGFDGVTEFLIFRILFYIGIEKYGEKPEVVKITKNLKGFYFTTSRLILSAGRPLILGEGKRWIDIMVYEASKDNIADIHRLRSALEIKAYPQGGVRGIRDTIERLKNIHKFYGESGLKLALIVYDYTANKLRSKVWKYLLREPIEDLEPIPDYIDVIVLSTIKDKIKNILMNYI